MYRHQKMRPQIRIGISLRIGLALFCTLASMVLAYVVLVGTHKSADATAGVSEIPSQGIDPWGISFDSNGNAWIAEPACDPGPYQCGGTPSGTPSIAQLNRSTFTIAHTFSVPQGYSSPFFTAEDVQGN